MGRKSKDKWKKLRRLAWAAILVMGICGVSKSCNHKHTHNVPRPKPRPTENDSQRTLELSEHVRTFVKQLQAHNMKPHAIGIHVEFVNQDQMGSPAFVGECMQTTDGKRAIFFSRPWWDRFDYYQREELVWHELGHCALDKPHNDAIKPDGHPASIMYPDISVTYSPEAEKYYVDHHAEYADELFHEDSPAPKQPSNRYSPYKAYGYLRNE